MTKSNKIQQTKKALLEALEKSLGIVTTACKQVGIDRTTFYRYIDDDEDFQMQVQDLENVALDFAESQLHQRIKSGSDTAIIFYLKTKGKKRGYIERVELGGADGKDLALNLVVPDKDSETQKLLKAV